ncbi:metallophosphoesterase [Candidatus Sumerlaeota bacterium]|nr:metallophosphoesterase [Candidatus Sumerlaeota bacterium]
MRQLFKSQLIKIRLRIGLESISAVPALGKRERTRTELIKSAFHDITPGLNSQMIERIHQKLDSREHFRFVVLGDTGRANRVFRYVLSEAIREEPDFIVVTGDVIRAGRISQYRRIVNLIKEIPIPIIFVPGNHDLKGEGYAIFSHIFGPPNYFFDIARYRFIILNSNEEVNFSPHNPINELPSDNGRHIVRKGIASEQLAHLSELLDSQKKHFLFMHIPPKGVWNHHCFKLNAEKLTQLLSEKSSSIARVFCGHIHGYSRKVYQNVTYIISAGAGGNFHHHDPEIIERYNFVLVDVSGDDVRDIVYFCDL